MAIAEGKATCAWCGRVRNYPNVACSAGPQDERQWHLAKGADAICVDTIGRRDVAGAAGGLTVVLEKNPISQASAGLPPTPGPML